MNSGLRALFLAAEADPFVKVGGLGDVAGSLPIELHRLFSTAAESAQGDYIDIRLAIPLHGVINRQVHALQPLMTFEIPSKTGPTQVEVFTGERDGLPVYLIGGPMIPLEAPVYTMDAGVDGLKFTFFSIAALELARRLDWAPALVHANDWHTAPAIYALSLNRDYDPFFRNTATLLGLHNLPYLGNGAGPALAEFGLPPARDTRLPVWARHFPLPLGLLSADHIVAASPNYAKEIMTVEFGSGLQKFLRTRKDSISGILNGIDVQRWDPQNDPALIERYNLDNLPGRANNKKALQAEFGLETASEIPLFAMVTRMDNQKGVDIVPAALRQVANLPWQVIILGTGDPLIEAEARKLQEDFPNQARAVIRFDAALSHRIYAGADALLIPSRYEPCGLTQMIAMRYGCVPVARATGGLRDTIQDYSPVSPGTGFLFIKPTSQELAGALSRAIEIYADQETWQNMQRAGMSQDFSWSRFARQYFTLYQSLALRRIEQMALLK